MKSKPELFVDYAEQENANEQAETTSTYFAAAIILASVFVTGYLLGHAFA